MSLIKFFLASAAIMLSANATMAAPIRADFLYKCFQDELWVKAITFDDNGSVAVTDWQEVYEFDSDAECLAIEERFNSK